MEVVRPEEDERAHKWATRAKKGKPFVGRHRRLATSRLGGYGSPLAWAPGKGPTRGGRHPAVVGAAV